MNHVESPGTDDATMERRLAAQAVAPRVRLSDLDAAILRDEYLRIEGTTLTICVLHLRNGFTVTGESAAASMENFDANVGKSLALSKARDKLWALLGYALKQDLWRASLPQMTEAPLDFKGRVRAEHRELNERLGKLEAFIDSPNFAKVEQAEQERMRIQARHMRNYSSTLGERMAAWGST